MSPRAAAAELLRRRRARNSLLHFTNFTFPQYRAEAAHVLIASMLDRVVSGEISRLMIFAPPQHGKSELVSVRLPAFWLGRRPDDPLILASYGADLAYSKSRQARQIVESEDFATLFLGVRTRRDSRAVNHCYTAGVLMGRSADALLAVQYYVLDVVRGQWSAGGREAVLKQTAELDAQRYGNRVVIWHEQEPGSGGQESAEMTTRRLAGYPVHADRVTGDKDVRLEPLAAQLEAGNVKLVRGPWNGEFIEEFCAVPNGTYRDQVDAAAGAFNKLARGRKVGIS